MDLLSTSREAEAHLQKDSHHVVGVRLETNQRDLHNMDHDVVHRGH